MKRYEEPRESKQIKQAQNQFNSMTIQGFMDWKGNLINKDKHGGTKAAKFIYITVAMSSMAFVSNEMNLVTYLRETMQMTVANSTTAVNNFIGGTCAFALLGGFLSDSYISRFKTILIFGPFEFIVSPSLCYCLCPSFYLVALGEGCLRANLPSFGGDQFDEEDSIEAKQKSSFFNWYTFNISVGALVGLIFIVWIESNRGWIGFTVSSGVVLLGILVLASGFQYYRYQTPRGSPITRILQVLIAAFRKRKLHLAENEEELHREHDKEEMDEVLPHTKSFKCLDKASISDGNSTEGWSLCTVTQVEETKIVLRMLPILLSAVIGYIPIRLLLTFTVQQGSTMNTKLGKVHVSPATLLIIPIVLELVLLVAYDRLFVPQARRITGCPTGITHLQRIGFGFISSLLATCLGAVIEKKRKMIAERHGLLESGAPVPMSVLWLGLQFLVLGVTDVFTFVGLLEFFNTEASRGIKSLGTAIFWCNLGLASLLGSILVDVVNKATKHAGGSTGWLGGNNLNQNHLDRFYWLLFVIGVVAFMNYLCWARRYKYRQHSLTCNV